MDHSASTPELVGRFETVDTETQTEQVVSDRPDLLEVAFVMVAVLKPMEMERLGEDCRDVVACDVRRERPRIAPHLRVGWTQVSEVGVPERVLCGAARVLEAQPVAMQEDHPRVYVHSPLAGGHAELFQRSVARASPRRGA